MHARKEIENYLLVPAVLERALDRGIADRVRRTGETSNEDLSIHELLQTITKKMRATIQANDIAKRVEFLRRTPDDIATVTKKAVEIVDERWELLEERMCIVPGKSVLACLRDEVTRRYAVNLTDHRIISEFTRDEVPDDLQELLQGLDRYRQGIRR